MNRTIRITTWAIALSLVGAATTALLAEDETRPDHHKHCHHDGHRHLPPLIQALDSDGDGAISSSEIANASTSLAKLDTNGDGSLTRDELRPKRGDRNCPKGGPKWNHPDNADTPAETTVNTPAEPVHETPAE
jgi:hypothetical protein